MSARLIDGKRIALEIRAEIAREVASRTAEGLIPPGLAVVMVGENPASASYVNAKTKACLEAGFHSVQLNLAESTTQMELLGLLGTLNADPTIDGILVQLPLPHHIDETVIVRAIDPVKDVDGFHPVNAGLLSQGSPAFVPCTPLGILELLRREKIETRGRHAVVLGRSNIVGRPMASLLSTKGVDATVTVCHSATQNLRDVVRGGDIVIAAIGRAQFVQADWLQPGATVIDVGINRVESADSPKGYRIVGDVDFEPAVLQAGAITPVPGGVGPMTIAMLLQNTLNAAKRR